MRSPLSGVAVEEQVQERRIDKEIRENQKSAIMLDAKSGSPNVVSYFRPTVAVSDFCEPILF